MKRKPPPQTGFGFDDPPKTLAELQAVVRLKSIIPAEPMRVPSLADLLRKSVGAPLKRGSETKGWVHYNEKLGAEPNPPAQTSSIESIGADTRKLYVKLAAKDGDWRAWHRLWPSVKPSPAMMNAFVSERAKYLEEQRAG